ncbi:HD-GYP domain-containing protein [Alicyclobacillus tolerans]|uniref:HD-GYP domain-containing protein n=1 Tax=Alicyclobacillus tolerans TaxID=90970 RepID=UPI001F389794|nr:HD-GYP domain-containing protein [Alicyclobacillus tolerans]MCF8567872.1 HD-GYP domain-containing protein [Alicyclobacillus tolerans]
MRIVSVEHLQSGMELAQNILGEDGRVLLRERVILTDRFIALLKEKGLPFACIQDSETYDIQPEESIRPEIQQAVVQRLKAVYDRVAQDSSIQSLSKYHQLSGEISALYDLLLKDIEENDRLVLSLNSMFTNDAYLYKHSMNVTAYALVVGMAHGLTGSRLREFGIGTLLHDIGKTQVDKEVLNRPGKLTESERREIEKHTQMGYDLLLKIPGVSFPSAHCALEHHEKYDGTGYPLRLAGEDIHEFGRMLAVADVYDALASNRTYRKAFAPQDALQYLRENKGTHFDPAYVDSFMNHVNVYPNGMPVKLTYGLSGVIARMDPADVHRPVVLVLNEYGFKVRPYELELSKHYDVEILACDVNLFDFAPSGG